MTKRGNPYPNRYRDKQETILTKKEFREYFIIAREMDRERERRKENPQFPFDHFIKLIKISALLSILYYTGLRISEIVGDVARKYRVFWYPTSVGSIWQPNPNVDDFVPYPTEPEIYIKQRGYVHKWTPERHGLRKRDIRKEIRHLRIDPQEVLKKGLRNQPLYIKLGDLGVLQIIEQWAITPGRDDTIFPIRKETAWRFISEVTDGRLYPHYFRLNRATKFAEDKETSIKDLQEWFGWRSPETLARYMGKAGKTTKKMADRIE